MTRLNHPNLASISNDFELVIRATKALEDLLDTYFPTNTTNPIHGTGHHQRGGVHHAHIGLHAKISRAKEQCGAAFTRDLVKSLRYLVTLRNKLVHENEFNALPDRGAFLQTFRRSELQLLALIADRRKNQQQGAKRGKLPSRPGKRHSKCTIC